VLTVEWLRGETSVNFLSFSFLPLDDEKFKKTLRLKIESPPVGELGDYLRFPTVLSRISKVLSKMYTMWTGYRCVMGQYTMQG
jgi:hypothetical protein